MTKEDVLLPTKRNVNLDLIRCVAVFFVLTVHLFKYIPFYDELFIGYRMWVLTVARTFFVASVPLFVLLSGYLCINKKLEKGYFKRLGSVLLTYLLASIFTVFVNAGRGEAFTVKEVIFKILKTSVGVIDYSWYIEMYIGLFLLIPYLNILYHGLGSKKQKQGLIGILLLLTMLPSVLNSHDLSSLTAFLKSGSPEVRYEIFPRWWSRLWPLTYYFIGAYIREFDVPISKRKNALILAGWALLVGSFLFYRSYNEAAIFSPGGDWESYSTVIHSVLLFLLLLHLDLSKLPGWIQKLMERISKLSLGIYLCSYATDMYVYHTFMDRLSSGVMKQMLGPLFMLVSFLLATLASQVLQWIMDAPKLLKKK